MELKKSEIQHMADLARLKISDKDLDYYTKELSAVLGYVEQLEKLNTNKVEPTSNIGDLDAITRKDETYGEQYRGRIGLAEKLMRLVPIKEKKMVKVKAVFNKID